MKQYDSVELLEDLNPILKKGMRGAILEVYDEGEAFEVEFVKKDAINYEYEGQNTFAVPKGKLKLIE